MSQYDINFGRKRPIGHGLSHFSLFFVKVTKAILLVAFIGLLSCSPFSRREADIIEFDGVISLLEINDSHTTSDPATSFIQEISLIHDLITDNHIQCSPNYAGTQGNSAWISISHPSLAAIHNLRLDSRGNMWVGTAGKGIAVFDGEKWNHWSINSEPPLAFDSVPGIGTADITVIAAIDYKPVTDSETTELNHKGAILVYNDEENNWEDTEVPFEVGKNINHTPSLAVNNHGEIFISFTVQESGTQESSQKDSGFVGSVKAFLGTNNTTRSEVSHKGKLGIYSNGEWKIDDMPTLPSLGINDAEIDSSGNYWLATHGAGVWMYNGQDWHVFSVSQGQLPWNNVTGLAKTKDGHIWAVTPLGIALLNSDGTSVVLHKENYPFTSAQLEAIAIDNDNRLWILSHDQISIYNGQEWAILTAPRAETARNWSYNMAFDKDGCAWFVKSGSAFATIFRNQIKMEAGDYAHLIAP